MKIGPTNYSLNYPDSKIPPAKAALDALETRPDLKDRPFGELVSLFARGKELPAPPPD